MKTQVLLILAALTLLFSTSEILAQRSIRIGYIDMDYILENVPEYNQAAAELESKVQKWKVEIEAELKAVEQMRKDLNNERVLLTKELIEEREEDILFKEKEILEYQQKRFGPNGDLFLQKRRLVQPVQDQVFVAVQEIAKNKRYDFIFDKSADLVMLYSADRYDISDQVLLRINRASKRKQVTERREKKQVERAEERNLEQENEISDREQQALERQSERERLLAERKAQRDSIRAAKKKEFEARRAQLLEAQQRKRDSINALRNENQETEDEDNDNN
ncbi:OmpH family outer membrane protein [Aquimarina brevivitae]|uniref:Periplasmic chaperone for outer membrane proteins Skp n=1 Tax=Aquimarina brevivitae TaxID=323412 RepID=A0A4Q7PGF3_9FLAO|nr:OmpH family outer membrane protein [Aquimarina brevivitae]RZS98830.1 periplasmic chaperone for outer membrane proteins Skp [Aquimarina brevivitae]